ncbi:MAG: DHH family phosphoesterase [Prevotellaceae bacterium]|nr:DHH family phosphoesterase [Prevotellaceae bacterium]
MDLNLLSVEEAQALDQKIVQSEHIVIVAHSRPDGDAIGSSLAWADYLVSHYGKQPAVIVPNAFPDFLHWLPGCERIMRYDKYPAEIKAVLDEADLLFILDLNQLLRTEDMEEALASCKAERVLMDHHIGPDIKSFLCISFPDLSSTSEVVFRVVWQLGGFDKLSSKFASCVYCGMMTDTGGFTYNSTRPEIYFIICQLLTKGIDKDKIYRNVFNNYSQWAIRLRGYLMSQRLNVFEDIHASYYTLTRQDMRNFHYKRGDGEGLVNEPLRIKGMKVSVSLREDDRIDNRIWVSLRSVDDFSVEEMAREFFNGGGHFNASGGKLDCSLDEAVAITRKAFQYYAEELKK